MRRGILRGLRSRTGRGLVLAVAAVALVSFGAPVVASPAAASVAGFTVERTFPNQVTSLSGFSCTPKRACVGVGQLSNNTPATFTSSDGGAHWELATDYTDLATLNAVSCVSATTCVAVATQSGTSDAASVVSTDGGRTWSAPANVGRLTSPFGVSCASAAHCVAAGQGASGPGAAVSVDGGAHWKPSRFPADGAYGTLGSVDCPTVSDCTAFVAGGATAYYSTDGGTRWQGATVPSEVGVIDSVTCAPKSVECFAAGQGDQCPCDRVSAVGQLSFDHDVLRGGIEHGLHRRGRDPLRGRRIELGPRITPVDRRRPLQHLVLLDRGVCGRRLRD